jgi:hypothetical protein
MDLRLQQFRRAGVPVVLQDSADPLRGLHPAMVSGPRWRQRLS